MGNIYIPPLTCIRWTEVPKRILFEDIDTTGADGEAVVFKSGVFNSNSLTIGADHTAESIKDDLWIQGIEIRTNSVKGALR